MCARKYPGDFPFPKGVDAGNPLLASFLAGPLMAGPVRPQRRDFVVRENAAHNSRDGEFIICKICRVPLSRWTSQLGTPAEETRQVHPLRVEPFDHEPEPIASVPADAAMICDFCGEPNPTVVFVPTAKKKVIGRIVTDIAVYELDMLSSPWVACSRCSPLVKKKQLNLLLDRTVRFHGWRLRANRNQRKILRAEQKKMYTPLFKAGLTGPFPIEERR